MKVAINKCYGGFGISTEAVIRLIEMGSPVLDRDEYGTEGWDAEKFVPHPANSEYMVRHYLDGIVLKDGVVYSFDRKDDNRTHPDLIRVIEELGEAADGAHARINIVEIPDGVEFEIQEYDGHEWIAESHRTWS